jgi:hypothetical protein
LIVDMIEDSQRKTSEGEANAGSGPADPTIKADPGGRSAGDPAPVSGGGLGPEGIASFIAGYGLSAWKTVGEADKSYRVQRAMDGIQRSCEAFWRGDGWR